MSTIAEIINNASLSPVGTASQIVKACDSTITTASKGTTISQTDDTPGLEDFLWTLWNEVLNSAQDRDAEADQARLIEVIRLLKSSNHQGFTWRIWGSETSWTDLPLLGPQIREAFNGPVKTNTDTSDPVVQAVLAGTTPDPSNEALVARANDRKRWLNLNHFLPKLWIADVIDLGLYGIWSARAALEGSESPDQQGPESLRLEVVALWIINAGLLMYQSHETYSSAGRGGILWTGGDGYSPARWAFWKRRLEEISYQPLAQYNSDVLNAIQAALHKMAEIEGVF